MQELTFSAYIMAWCGFTTPNINREVYTTHAQAEKKFRLSAIKPMKYLNNTGYISLPYFDVPESTHCSTNVCRHTMKMLIMNQQIHLWLIKPTKIERKDNK